MTISISDFRTIETGITLALESVYGDTNNNNVDSVINAVRRHLKNKDVKIERRDDSPTVSIVFPQSVIEPPLMKKQNKVSMYKKADAEPTQEAEGATHG
jgi:hypothetical protein